MKFVIQTVAIALFSFLLAMFLPWYSISIVAFAFGYFLRSNGNFYAGFIAIALAWGLQIFIIEISSSSDLADRVAQIFPVQSKSLLIVLTLFLGGLIGGLACLSGSLLRPSEKKSYYQR
jgi:hypothetical protein